jgi:hypothetical protein
MKLDMKYELFDDFEPIPPGKDGLIPNELKIRWKQIPFIEDPFSKDLLEVDDKKVCKRSSMYIRRCPTKLSLTGRPTYYNTGSADSPRSGTGYSAKKRNYKDEERYVRLDSPQPKPYEIIDEETMVQIERLR